MTSVGPAPDEPRLADHDGPSAGGSVDADTFMAQRGRLFGIAYRILGSVADAEDVVQDTWLAWQGADPRQVRDPAAYLTRAASRRALNRLRDNARRREQYVGPWLPEPVSTEPGPEESAALADSMTMAMLVLLDTMTPLERAAFVLCEVFAVPAPEAAEALGRSPAAVRQLVARARKHAREHAPVTARNTTSHARVASVFAAAVASGDLDALLAVLAPDVQFVSDGGGLVRAALRPVVGADRVARLILGLVQMEAGSRAEPKQLNGLPGFVVTTPDGDRSAVQFDIEKGVITRLWVVRNPAKLGGI